MSLVAEAIARYHKSIESEPYIDLAWAAELQDKKKAQRLAAGPVSPVLRPHLLTSREYTALVKTSEVLFSAIERVSHIMLENPALMARLQVLPAEKMLAAVDPGYEAFGVKGTLHASLSDSGLTISGHRADAPLGVIYGEALADLYFDAAPVRELRKKFKLKKFGATKPLLQALAKTYKASGGKQKKPTIAIVEINQGGPNSISEHAPLAEYFTREGYPTQVIAPEHLEYRNGVLRKGDFAIDIVYRNVRLQEFLIRYDLNHPLVRAYKERAVCMINSFRAELGSKAALFDLLTDEKLTASFPAAERKAIRDHVPWTRVVTAAKTTHKNHTIDLPDYVLKHRTKLVLRPNDENAEIHPIFGSECDDSTWERALRQAMRTPFVVQEVGTASHSVFPMLQFGSLMMKDMRIDLQPHSFLGQVHGVSCWLDVAGGAAFSTLTGLAPTFLIEGK
jgi:hypothetical protein